MKRILAILTMSFIVSACDQEIPTGPMAPGGPSAEILDAAHNGLVEGFYFLPPAVPEPTTTGTFNPLVQPRVVICELDTSVTPVACASTLAEYTLTSGMDGATISVSTTDEHYMVNWNTKNFTLSTEAIYRIQVFLTVHPGALNMGHADVQVGANKGELKNVDTDEYITLVDDQTLPIKFRIENGAGCEGDLDCGSGTIGSDGGIVTTANGAAGVSFPAGAVDNPITINIRQLDPAQQPGGLCLPTGIRQDGACYDFDTEQEISSVQNDKSNTFHFDVTVGICPSPNAVRPERLTLHKYNPERYDTEGVVELPNAPETFLRCGTLTGPGYAAAPASLFGRLAGVARRILSPVASALFPGDLYATDTGRAGTTDSFSRITWAESITVAASGAPASAEPGTSHPIAVSAITAHNHELDPTAGTDAQLRFDYTDADGVSTAWYATTDGQGAVALSWQLTQATGVHTLVISSRDTDPSLGGDPLLDDAGDPLIQDPTPFETVRLVVCEADLDCGLGTVDENGGVVTTADKDAGVSFPEGAVLEPVTVVIQEVALDATGRCLPTGIRQDGACYDFDTVEEISTVTGGSDTFLKDVTVAICLSTDAVRPERLTLHKYNPERAAEGVVELPGATETFLDCPTASPDVSSRTSGFMGRLAHAAGRALSLLAPRPLYATDTGRAGTTDSFSRITWAESLRLSASGVPGTSTPGETLTGTVSGLTAHNHDDSGLQIDPVAAADAQLRFDYTDPDGLVTAWYATTDPQGEVALSWPLTQTSGTHTLVVSSRDVDPAVQGAPLISDPTPHVVLTVEVGIPDLLISELTTNTTDATVAQDVVFDVTVTNVGGGPAAASTLLFHRDDETPGAEGTLIPIEELQPGQSVTKRRVLTAPHAESDYVNTATVDYDFAVAESDEQNNSTSLNWSAVAPDGSATDAIGDAGSGPDLAYASAAVSETSLVLTIQFEGNRAEEQSSTRGMWMLDTDEDITTGSPGVTSAGADSEHIGTDYILFVDGSLAVTLRSWTGSGFTSTILSSVSPVITDLVTGWSYQIVIPLSQLGGDEGRLTFKALSTIDNGDGTFSGVMDYLTDVGNAAVQVH